MHNYPDFLIFFARFHPLLVHLPIGMLVALAMLEVAAWLPRFKNANASAGYLIALAAPLAVAAAACGWLLSHAGGYDARLLAWHEWLGISTAIGSVLSAILFWKKYFNAYRLVLLATTAVLMVAGHLGGSLTHGSDYLGRYAPGPLKWLLGANAEKPAVAAKDLTSAPVFDGVIAPILESRCVECHGPAKSKADLRLDSFAGLMKGGEDGVIVKAGDAAQSPLTQRVLLPKDDDDHMPPVGKPQLTADQITLLKWWIEAGAPEQKRLNELQPPAEITKIVDGLGAGNNGRIQH